MEENLIVCTGLQKRFGNAAALRKVDLTVGRGKIVGLVEKLLLAPGEEISGEKK